MFMHTPFNCSLADQVTKTASRGILLSQHCVVFCSEAQIQHSSHNLAGPFGRLKGFAVQFLATADTSGSLLTAFGTRKRVSPQ